MASLRCSCDVMFGNVRDIFRNYNAFKGMLITNEHTFIMSDQIPTNLKSGVGSNFVEGGISEGLCATTTRLIAMVVVMTQQASDVAYMVAVHDNRSQATAEDVNGALKYQARHFLQSLDDPEVVNEVMQMEEDLFGEESADEEEAPDEVNEEEVRRGAEVRDNVCMCKVCAKVRESVGSWESWDPEDQAEAFLRRSVERAISSFEGLHKEEDT